MSLCVTGRVPAGLFQRKALIVLIALAAAFGPPAGIARAQSVAPSRAEYRLNAGDVLDIFVWGEEKLQREARILPDGTFTFPLAGTIQAEGKTARQVSTEIQARIHAYFRTETPEVTVAVKDTSGMRFYVIGKVRAPGSFSIGRSVNALQALSLAGGPAEFANVDQAVILHETPNGQSVEPVHLSDILKGARAVGAGEQVNLIPVLRSGDVLVIP